jgi:hypothetical protein
MGAQRSFEVRLENSDLRPIRISKEVLVSGDLPTARPSTIYLFNDNWLYWPFLVHAAPGPVTDDRLYYTGDGVPKVRIGSDVFIMAITPPATKLTAAKSGTGTGDITTRLYVYTNVSQFGEESEPSPLSDPIDWQEGETVTLSGFSTAMGDRTATLQRIYRSQTSLSGDTTLYLIDERGAATNDYVDTVPLSNIQEPLPSLDWNQPPDDMSGLVSMPNGMMAAFTGKEVLFCEPYFPSAWPQKYRLTVDYDVVALGVFGTTLAVLTTGHPYLAQGTAPENMLLEKLELDMPCINAAGVIDMGCGVVRQCDRCNRPANNPNWVEQCQPTRFCRRAV